MSGQTGWIITPRDRLMRDPALRATLDRVASLVDRAAFAFLLLATGALLLRPADIVPALAGAPLYELCMLGCLAASLPRMLCWCGRGCPWPGATVTLALLLVPAVILSHLARLDTWDARLGGFEAAKVSLLFLLAVTLLDSAGRLRTALLAMTASVLGMSLLAIMSYHGVLSIGALTSVVQHGLDGEPAIRRLVGTGVFNDPNDFALMLVVCLCVSGYTVTHAGPWRWAAPVAFLIFAYALVLTHSRGGMMSAVAAAGALVVGRLGWRGGIPVLAAIGGVLLIPAWGRQTTLNLDDPEDTFQARLELWSASLDAFRGSPFFGIGQGKLTDAIGQVTHNSFLHAFAEMGFFGGAVFLGVFFAVVLGLWRVRPADPDLGTMRPFILAMVVGYGAGLLALSRCYTAPTQLLLGLGTAFLLLGWRSAGASPPRLDGACARRVTALAAVFLIATYVVVRVMLRRGA